MDRLSVGELKMKHEYHEGPKDGENCEQLARAAFQASMIAVPKKHPLMTNDCCKERGAPGLASETWETSNLLCI
jgi:hypothetical protein